MDIDLNRPEVNWKKWIFLFSLIVGISYTIFQLGFDDLPNIDIGKVTFEKVQQGNLDIYVEAYGKLYPENVRLITAPSKGVVTEILVRPGTTLKKDDVVIRLSNPQLLHEYREDEAVLIQMEASLSAFKYEQKIDLLDFQSRISDYEAKVETAKLEVQVNQQLIEKGGVSKIDFQRAKLSLRLHSKQLASEQQKYEQFKEMQQLQLIQKTIINEQQAVKVKLLEQQYQNMAVASGLDGSLQTLDVQLGQSVQEGEPLAKVGSDMNLIARINVPQKQADQIAIGSPVTIDTQKGLLQALITRVESMVVDGMVIVEARITSPLTSNARSELPVVCNIFLRKETRATFIKQVSGLRPDSKLKVFVRTKSNLAEARDVTFGELSQDKLLVKNGLLPDEEIISSSLPFENADQIIITQ